MSKKLCPNCEAKLGGFLGNAPFQCKGCEKIFCKRCTKGFGPVRKCPSCAGKAQLKRSV